MKMHKETMHKTLMFQLKVINDFCNVVNYIASYLAIVKLIVVNVYMIS